MFKFIDLVLSGYPNLFKLYNNKKSQRFNFEILIDI